MKILVIDDNAHHAELASHVLKREGWDVETSENPNPGPHFRDFDVILLDYSMPQMSGLDVLKRLKDLDIPTPVVFLTGHGTEVIASEAIKQGAYDYIVKDTELLYLDRIPPVLREARSKYDLIETNKFLIQELRKANERLQRMSFTDEMTGIFNYRFMQNQLELEVQRAARYNKNFSICLIDIDHFKQINDEYGHPAGDQVLKNLALILKDATRSVDFVGRYAGDEFMIIFPDTTIADAIRLCERIRRAVAEYPFNFNGNILRSTISVGVADFDIRRRASAASLIETADRCLYQAKRKGRNCVSSSLRVMPPKDGQQKETQKKDTDSGQSLSI